MKGVNLLKVFPERQSVITVLKSKISPAIIRQICGQDEIVALELGVFGDFPVRVVAPARDLALQRSLPRWQFRDSPPCAGMGVLFGANAEGKAASAPLSATQAMQEITWLPSLEEIGEALPGLGGQA